MNLTSHCVPVRLAVRVAAVLLALSSLFVGRAGAQQTLIAYEVAAGTTGTQNFGGSIGMDFDVNNPIIITRLGVFDDTSNGLLLPLTARLFDRATMEELAFLEFTPEDPGVLIGGSRFKPLATPITLGVGRQGTISADGYGAEEQLRNTGGAPAPWTLNDGSGSIQFVGVSRYSAEAGAFPETPDGGPVARYAAGTFEYTTTTPLAPGAPVVTLSAGDQAISLSWAAVTQPLPAATYRIFRATSGGTFSAVGDVSATEYTSSGLENGVEYCFQVQAIAANGKEGPKSRTLCAAPYRLEAGRTIAYIVPPATEGNQAFDGMLGLDFDVVSPVKITRLGVFDDQSDGLKRTIVARVFNRATSEEVTFLEFTPEAPGVLIQGSRFKALPQPLALAAGFVGTITAENYGEEERDGNRFPAPWTTESGNGSIQFVGARYGITQGIFPDAPDGTANRYAAGTFEFELGAGPLPGRPNLDGELPAGDKEMKIFWPAVTAPIPAVTYRISKSSAADGTFSQIAEIPGTEYVDTGLVNGTDVCYKVVAVGAGGQLSLESRVVCGTPNAPSAGIAYFIPAGTAGGQAYEGSLGMDFDVARPVRVTRIGVFDSESDGLFRTITAAIYDRDTETPVSAILEFTTENAGTLVDGSRFKDLPTPIVLPAGFHGTIVARGYGEGELDFNIGGGNPADQGIVTFDGASLRFVGGGRYGDGAFPENVDGGPANRYAAGTFAFEPVAPATPLQISVVGDKVRITWTGAGSLQTAASPSGAWEAVPGAAPGIEVPIDAGRAAYYRLVK